MAASLACWLAACGSSSGGSDAGGGSAGQADGSAGAPSDAGDATGAAGATDADETSDAGGSTGAAGAIDGGTTGAAGSTDAGATDAGGMAGTSGTAGSGAAGAAGAGCSPLTLSGDPVAETAAAGTIPTATFGTLAEGTYLLTKWEVYAPATPTAKLHRETLRRTGNQVELIVGAETSVLTSNMTFSVGSNGGWTVTCGGPIGAGVVQNFTASPTTFLLFVVDSKLRMTGVKTFTKQ